MPSSVRPTPAHHHHRRSSSRTTAGAPSVSAPAACTSLAADPRLLRFDRPEDGIARWPFACLLLQHASSAWTDRTFEFGAYLFLTVLFPASFIPAALLGLLTTGAGLLFSGWVGGLVDDRRRLSFVRAAIAVQKLSVAAAYALFIGSFAAELNARGMPSGRREILTAAALPSQCSSSRYAPRPSRPGRRQERR